jgi:phage terminase large subunit-like protein
MDKNSEFTSGDDGDTWGSLGAESESAGGSGRLRTGQAGEQVRDRPRWANSGRAARNIAWIEQLTVPSGKGAGKPLKLRQFQCKFLYAIYEPHWYTEAQWKLIVRTAILSIARKNGKTALISALVLLHLCGPEAVINGEIYSAANDREQAAQVFKMATQMIRLDPDLEALLDIIDSKKRIVCLGNGSFYAAVSSEAGTKHGYNPTVVIYDELAQSKSRELFDTLDTGMGAREEPLMIIISTQNNEPEHLLSQMIDDGLTGGDETIVCHLYEVPLDKEGEPEIDIFDEKIWELANPALADFRSLDDMRRHASRAKRMPSFEPVFRNLYLNQRVQLSAGLISRADWKACQRERPEIEKGSKIYLSLDMSDKIDLSCLMMGTAEDAHTHVIPFFWKPRDYLREHSKRDFGTGSERYYDWVKNGTIIDSPGRTIKKEAIVLKIRELCTDYEVLGLAYDRWRMEDLRNEFDRIGFETHMDGDEAGQGLRLVDWGQGFKDMTPAIEALEQAVLDQELTHPGNHCLTWNVSNTVVVPDPAGNRKLDKVKSKFRIDGGVALTILCGLKSRDRIEAELDLSEFLSNPLGAK